MCQRENMMKMGRNTSWTGTIIVTSVMPNRTFLPRKRYCEKA